MFFDVLQQFRLLGNQHPRIAALSTKSKLAINDIKTNDLGAIILSASRGPTLIGGILLHENIIIFLKLLFKQPTKRNVLTKNRKSSARAHCCCLRRIS